MRNSWIQILLLLLTIALLALVVFDAPVWLLMLLLFILLLLLLWWLYGAFSKPYYPPEEFFVQDQFIIRGPRAGVDRVVEEVAQSIKMERRDDEIIEFSQLEEAIRDCLSDCSSIDFTDYVIALYRLTGSEADVAAAIQAINQAAGRGGDVQAEPNWLSGYPWKPTGSGWELEGNPWKPTGSSAAEDHYAEADLFMKQWAFEEIGLQQEKDSSGRGVRVGVFDTSPYPETDPDKKESPDWVDKPSQLTVGLNFYPTPEPASDDPDLSSHGLFASGLVHAVAPDAEIQLIRVLGSNNIGDLFSLNVAIFEFIKSYMAADDLIGAVINMSLGIRVEEQFKLPTELQSFRELLRAAQCAQIMVVAAAGNDSANLPRPEPANLPANWPEIFGVAGSTNDQNRSCFSNQGNIAAPAGNGRSDARDKDKQCIPANHLCDDETCGYAVIGPILKTHDKDNEGYAFWSGTSFATPMVTGLAALVMEKGRGQLSPQEVRRIIECGARPANPAADDALGKGIIHVADTLNDFRDCAEKLGISLDDPNQQSAA
jgi:subtilisin family serine protease